MLVQKFPAARLFVALAGLEWWMTWIAAMICALFTAAGAVQAQEARQFYQGKTVQIVVGYEPGGGYDAYARLIARTMFRYIPGNPVIIIQNMPGAGSIVAANWLYNVAPRDGTALGTIVQSTPLNQVFKEPGVRYDATQFNWIGNPIVDNFVTISWAASGLATLEDVKAKGGLICGSPGAGPTNSFPIVLKKMLGMDTRVVTGYPGVSAVMLSMQRGEVNCLGSQAWSSMKATMDQMMRDGQLKILVQWGAEAEPEISAFAGRDVPIISAYAQNDLDRSALRLLTSTAAISRPLLAPPGVPEDRVELLRLAFDQTMKDPTFLEEASKGKADIKPLSGAAIQAFIQTIVHTPEADVKRAIELSQ